MSLAEALPRHGAPIIEVEGIHKVYGGDVVALKDINLEMRDGALTCLLGPSGCGKTTLLKIIAGLLQPTAGEVRVKGRRVTGPGSERGFVFQDFALMPWATVLRNAAFGLEMQGIAVAEREERARHYIAEVGLEGCDEKYPHELSGGMRQRVGLARALAVEAEVLLMDEPFSAVDEQTRRKFQEDLIRLRVQERKTFVLVTHSIEEAVYLADRIVLLSPRPGRVAEVIDPEIERHGDPDAIRRQPEYLDLIDRIWRGLRAYVE